MNRFTNPLDSIRVASPCKADWNQMYGNNRKRFCADCKLNVYNLSDMTLDEAENFLMKSEGCVCVRYFRRADGTVLTKNCPVGWRAVRQRVSRVAVGAFSILVSIVGGICSVRTVDKAGSIFSYGNVSTIEAPGNADLVPVETPVGPADPSNERIYVMGEYLPFEVEGQVDLTDFRRAMNDKGAPGVTVVGETDWTTGK